MSSDQIFRLLKLLPNRQNDRLKQYFNVSVEVVRRIIDSRKARTLEEDEKDILTVLRAKYLLFQLIRADPIQLQYALTSPRILRSDSVIESL